MSKKDVDIYYKNVTEQYHSFKEELEDFEQLCSQKLVAPELVVNAKKQFEIVKNNWERLNYVIYLLNRPVRKSKHDSYKKQHEELLNSCVTDKDVIDENTTARNNFQRIVK